MDFIKDFLSPQLNFRPISQPTDLVKLVFQAVMGGGHLISDPEVSLKYLKKEISDSSVSDDPLFERLGYGTCRYNVASKESGLSPKTLNRLFVYSAEKIKGTAPELQKALNAVKDAVADGSIDVPFSADEFVKAYPKEGQIPRHSEEYRNRYHPAYRVLTYQCMQFYPLIAQIESSIRNGTYPVICIDGMAASGKSSLAELLSAAFDCAVFSPDDYFLTPEQRTPERLSGIGDFFDRERMYGEIISNLGKNEISYRRYDCGSGEFIPQKEEIKNKTVIVEGVYSAHPSFKTYYDIGVFLKTSPEVQSQRILARNGEFLHGKFINEWIPRENLYFSHFGIEKRLSEKGFIFNT